MMWKQYKAEKCLVDDESTIERVRKTKYGHTAREREAHDALAHENIVEGQVIPVLSVALPGPLLGLVGRRPDGSLHEAPHASKRPAITPAKPTPPSCQQNASK